MDVERERRRDDEWMDKEKDWLIDGWILQKFDDNLTYFLFYRSLACTVMEILTGFPPQSENYFNSIFWGEQHGFCSIDAYRPPFSSDLCWLFIKYALNPYQALRPNAELLLRHPWITRMMLLWWWYWKQDIIFHSDIGFYRINMLNLLVISGVSYMYVEP